MWAAKVASAFATSASASVFLNISVRAGPSFEVPTLFLTRFFVL